MKCAHCNNEIEKNDKFCSKCGHFTSNGYTSLKEKGLLEGVTVKQQGRFSLVLGLFFIGILMFLLMMIIRGQDLFKPILYLKKQVNDYIFGYNTSIIKYDNKYEKENILSYTDAISFIKKDFNSQKWQCYTELNVRKIEEELENKYSIPSVSFCDLDYDMVLTFKKEIDKMYKLFPKVQGLTNITFTNIKNENYIAYFQPMYQFVNVSESINSYNKVNKTQILLNSYYFLNKDYRDSGIKKIVGDNYYVEDATLETTLVHEFGHFISFSLLLKEYKISNITFETKENSSKINEILELSNKGIFSKKIIEEAMKNYNQLYKTNLNIDKFASSISKYASVKDKNNNLIYDETIAEAIHDYYLHDMNMKNSSKEIIKVIKTRFDKV